MAKYQGDVLAVLQSELTFLEGGGYKWCLQKPWRPPLAFVESRTCPKHAGASSTCDSCALMQFVPAESLGEKIPCWHIPLNEAGENLDSLYQFSTEEELNQSLKTWLWSMIMSVEDERRSAAIARRRQGLQNHSGAPAACEARR